MRIKTILFSVAVVLATLSFGSCSDEPTHIESSTGSGMNVKDEIVLDGVNSTSLNIRATEKPNVECDVEWLKVGEVKSLTTGIYTVELTAEVNATGETRTAKVTVTAGKETSVVTVTQYSGDVVEVRSVVPQGDLDPNGGTLTIKYSATGKPATNLPEWIKESRTRALEDGTLTFTYLANNSGKAREGMIVLATGKAVTNVSVRQPARP